MKSPNISAGKSEKADAGWFLGMNSVRNPWFLSEGQYRRGVNIVNRGGVAQTRPGYKMRLILPKGNLQGMHHFNVNKSGANLDFLVFAVDGAVYASPFPLQQPKNWNDFKIPRLRFDAAVDQLYFCTAEKSIQTLEDSSLQVVPTHNVLMIQDGKSPAGFWDGELSRHLSEASPDLETPRGTWMTFSGNRLWVAREKLVLASDFLDPLKFLERTEGEGRGDFSFKDNITGLTSFMGNDRAESVIIFTQERSETLNSGIRDRSLWSQTRDFQAVLFPSTGCVSGRSIVFQAGLMWWYSQGGLVSSDATASSMLTSQVNYKDAEMAFNKQFLAPDLSGVCAASFENYLLISVPINQNFNSETFVLDYSTVSEAASNKIPAWSGAWTGIRPVQWTSALIGSEKRLFAASVDYRALSDGSHNHIWEAFSPDRYDSFFELDSDFTLSEYIQPIYCEFETRLLGDGQSLKVFSYAEVDFIELAGDVHLRVDYRGRRGAYKKVACKKILAPTNYELSGSVLTKEEFAKFGELAKQSRRVFTEDGDPGAGCPTCEDTHSENIDKAFSLLIRWCGQGAVEAVRLFMDAYPEDSKGKCESDESALCIVDELGQNQVVARDRNFIPPEVLFTTDGAPSWFAKSTYTETLSCASGSVVTPLSVTAEASYRSFISQSDANLRAQIAAQQSAENQAAYLRTQYPCYWDAMAWAETSCYGELNDRVNSLAYDTSGFRFVFGGRFYLDRAAVQGKISVRTAVDGIRQLWFASGTGFSETSSGEITRIARRSLDDSFIVIGNFSEYNGSALGNIAVLTSSGELQPGVSVFASGSGFNAPPTCICDMQSDGFFVGGPFTKYKNANVKPLVLLDPFGFLRGMFVISGFTEIYDIAQYAPSQVAVLGYHFGTNDVRISVLDLAGTKISGFTTYVDSVALAPGAGRIAVQPDGKIVASFTGADSGKNLLRLNANGTLDTDFSTAIGSGPSDPFSEIIIFQQQAPLTFNPETYIFGVGSFATFSGSATYAKAVLLNSTGALVTNFVPKVFAGGNPRTAAFDPVNRNLWIGGSFTSYGGIDESAYLAAVTLTGFPIPFKQTVSRGGFYRSTINQADADTRALAAAQDAAQLALPCP